MYLLFQTGAATLIADTTLFIILQKRKKLFEAPQREKERMKKGSKKESRLFDVCILLFFGLFTAGLTSVLFYFYPVSVLTCQYVEPNQVNCCLEERAVGLI
ncbi:MAG: hypothetical protein D3910_12285, partial [Candidatus Electrothrix sp. ATG2]|nr:hypothetical protein [Candidatus Electrothrix sp. ATG2]